LCDDIIARRFAIIFRDDARQSMADFDRDGLIVTNSTKQDFLRARVCIEEPLGVRYS